MQHMPRLVNLRTICEEVACRRAFVESGRGCDRSTPSTSAPNTGFSGLNSIPRDFAWSCSGKVPCSGMLHLLKTLCSAVTDGTQLT